MIKDIHGYKILAAFRSKNNENVQDFVKAVLRMGRLVQDLSEMVSQIDINPLVVLEEGKGVVALDALFVPSP